MAVEHHTAFPQQVPQRLQEYGVGIFNSIHTKSALKKALKKKLISVDGKIATTATFIKGGELIEFKEPVKLLPEKELHLDLEVVFEDDYLAIVNKPAGILVSGNRFKTIANALQQNLKKSPLSDVVLPQPVHRLDYPTTGLLLVGKTNSSILALNKLFENRAITKTYMAVTIGAMKEMGVINIPINDKESQSFYKVLGKVDSERFGKLNLVALRPKTGRRHQLRKHLKFIGNPILGDAEYGLPDLILKGKGLYLHAFSLAFEHPITNERLYFEKELPKKFNKLFSKVKHFPKKTSAANESTAEVNN